MIDWYTVGMYFLLVLFGWFNIYAAVFNEEYSSIFDLGQRYGKQMTWILVALALVAVMFFIESHVFSLLSYFVYGFMIILLVAVLLFGKEVNGARSWFEFGFFRLQPAEFTKIAVALALSKLLSHESFRMFNIKSLAYIAVVIGTPAILIIFQNDTGSSLVYGAFILVLYREGMPGYFLALIVLAVVLFTSAFFINLFFLFIILVGVTLLVFLVVTQKWKETLWAFLLLSGFFVAGLIPVVLFQVEIELYILAIFSVVFASIFFLVRAYSKKITIVFFILPALMMSMLFTFSVDYIFNNVLEKHQQTRINVLFGIEQDLKGAGYNVHQSKIAIGSGGLVGKGFLQGTQTKLDFVPEQDTDFIFCTVGEEWGFVGTTTVIVIFLAFILRILFLAERQNSAFSRIYGYCVASILFFHFAVNIGMTIGLAPVIGIPLPFFSYGGSSLWSFTILLFIFIKLDVSRNETL